MKVLVCGGRDFHDYEFMVEHLEEFHALFGFTELITGHAEGADTIAEIWAEQAGITVKSYPIEEADWKAYGKAAGFRRNQLMLDQEHPELVMAFPGGNGTAHMVEIAEKADVTVWQSKRVLFENKCTHFGFLSNFALGHEFVDQDGLIWMTSEHYYQAHKSPSEHERGYVQTAPTPAEAKRRGRAINCTKDWDIPPWEEPGYGGRKEVVMREALAYKFAPGTPAASLLLGTRDDYLVEYAPWSDTYWGIDKRHVGLNRLGKMLMERRQELRKLDQASH